MLGIDRRTASYAWTVALVLLLLAFVYLIRTTLFVFVLAVLFAYLLSPLVDLLDRFLPTRTRTPALALAYLIFVGAVGVTGFEIGSKVADEANRLVKELPAQIEKWKAPGDANATGLDRYRAEIIQRIQVEIATGSHDFISRLPEAGYKFLSVASSLLYAIIIPVLAFFFLKDGKALRAQALVTVSNELRRTLLDEVLADLDILLAHYMRALVVLSVATFIAYTAALLIIGVPYAFLLGALGALLEFIPMLGPITAGVVVVGVALVSGSHVLAVVCILLLYRMFQDYVLSPHLMGRGVQLHPLLVLFGVFAGGELAGVAGTFLSVPVLALARILYLRIRKARAVALAPPPESPEPVAP